MTLTTRSLLFTPRPRIVCLCGSTRFRSEFVDANFRETLAGRIVVTIGCDLRTDAAALGLTAEAKLTLDELHLHKIELADEVLILNVGGYFGRSTKRELWYAAKIGRAIRWLEPERAVPDPLELFPSESAWLAAAADAAAG